MADVAVLSDKTSKLEVLVEQLEEDRQQQELKQQQQELNQQQLQAQVARLEAMLAQLTAQPPTTNIFFSSNAPPGPSSTALQPVCLGEAQTLTVLPPGFTALNPVGWLSSGMTAQGAALPGIVVTAEGAVVISNSKSNSVASSGGSGGGSHGGAIDPGAGAPGGEPGLQQALQECPAWF